VSTSIEPGTSGVSEQLANALTVRAARAGAPSVRRWSNAERIPPHRHGPRGLNRPLPYAAIREIRGNGIYPGIAASGMLPLYLPQGRRRQH
jgi:hypothetical protein